MRPKVFVSRKIPESGIKILRKKCDVVVSRKDGVLKKKELISAVKGKDALLCLLTDKIDSSVMRAGKNLKIVSNYAVGFDNIDLEAATRMNIPVSNTPGALTDSVADHACALLLSLARRIPESDRFTRAGKYKGWAPLLLIGQDLKDKTLGILGLGRIGSAVAERMHKGFGMNIIYYDIRKNPKFERSVKAKYASVKQLLKRSDFVSVHVPLLPSTRHLIDARALRSMKKTACLINTSRGPVVDEAALVSALKNRVIAGAALDVFEREPMLARGLSGLDNVVLTPHTASATKFAREEMSKIAAQNILDVLGGKKPRNLVNADVYKK